MCVDHARSEVSVTPKYLQLDTLPNTVPLRYSGGGGVNNALQMGVVGWCFDCTIQCDVISKHVYITVRGNCSCNIIVVTDNQQRAKYGALWNA